MIRKELRNTLESCLLAAFGEDYSIRIIDCHARVGYVEFDEVVTRLRVTAVPQTGSDEMRFFRGPIHMAKSR